MQCVFLYATSRMWEVRVAIGLLFFRHTVELHEWALLFLGVDCCCAIHVVSAHIWRFLIAWLVLNV